MKPPSDTLLRKYYCLLTNGNFTNYNSFRDLKITNGLKVQKSEDIFVDPLRNNEQNKYSFPNCVLHNFHFA
jgi:hypothetical protein